MAKKGTKLRALEDDYFRELAQRSEGKSLELEHSPLVAARKRLASYVGVVLWRLYKSEVKRFDACFTFMDGVSKREDYFDERVFDGLEGMAADFRQTLVELEVEKPSLKESDLEELLAVFDRLLQTVVEVKAKRHPLAFTLQHHFYHTVYTALEGRRDELFRVKRWGEQDLMLPIFELAKEARDELYLHDSPTAAEVYVKSIREVMEYPAYADWNTQVLEHKPWLSPLPLAELPKLTADFEVELLWNRLTKDTQVGRSKTAASIGALNG